MLSTVRLSAFSILFIGSCLIMACDSKLQKSTKTEEPKISFDDLPSGETLEKSDDSIEVLRLKAESGDPKAQYELGFCYHKGKGVPQDSKEAVKWYRMAAEQGVANAQYNLGRYYDDGYGVPKDDKEALKWYRMAAEQGVANAQLKLAGYYIEGNVVPRDDVVAYMWLNLAATDNAGVARDRFEKIITPEQIAEGQKLSHEWMKKHEKSE